MGVRGFIAAWLAVLAFLSGIAAVAQEETDPWREAVLPISVEEGRLAGDGATWLRGRASASQFILFGEQHGVAGLPDYVTATYEELYTDGFHYLALETGPWFAQQLSSRPVDDVLREYPYALAFDYDEEVAMLRAVEARYDGQGQRIWGLDQEFIAIHALQRLAEIAPTAETRRLARGLFLKAALKGGEFSKQDYSRDLIVLREAMGEAADEEARFILDSLLISQRIFVDWRKANRGEQPFAVSVEAREQYMKDNLDALLAAHGGGRNVRVIFKLGGAHIIDGPGVNNVDTLGSHVEMLARRNGLEALHIGIRAYDTAKYDWLPLSEFEGGDAVLIDTKLLLAYLTDEEHDALPESLQQDLDGFDTLIYLKDPGNASRGYMFSRGQHFREDLLKRLAIVLVPLGLLATGIVILLRFLWRTVSKGGIQPQSRPVLPGLLLTAATAGGIALAVMQVLAIPQPAAADPSALTGTLLSAPGLPAVIAAMAVAVALAFAAFFRGWWGLFSRLHFLVVTLGAAGFVWFLYYWNIGGMLGG